MTKTELKSVAQKIRIKEQQRNLQLNIPTATYEKLRELSKDSKRTMSNYVSVMIDKLYEVT